jgi:DEAD/DEAH box helicase domain-containing protein
VIDEPGGGRVLAEVDADDAPEILFPGAIYQLEGTLWQVARLDHAACKAYVSSVKVDYYTEAITSTRVRILECVAAAGCARQGEVHVLHRVSGFKKIKLVTGENVGYGEVSLPDQEMHTSAFWLSFTEGGLAALRWSAAEVVEASLALSQALHAVSALLLMGDRGDLGRAVGDARSGWSSVPAAVGTDTLRPDPGTLTALGPYLPTLFLFDRYPGGTGLSERLFECRQELLARARRLVEGCACRRGCPSCIGPGRAHGAKQNAVKLIELAQAELAPDAEVAA